jgi:arylsulfatase A-like enzyme
MPKELLFFPGVRWTQSHDWVIRAKREPDKIPSCHRASFENKRLRGKLMLTRRSFLNSAVATMAATVVKTAESKPRKRPNVVFILADDQRWDCMSCAGHPLLKTPNMDRLAVEGARFTNAFSTTALCSPARASFLSGLYGHAHGVINNFTDYPKYLPSYPCQLQAAGYKTAYIGKFHMGEQFDEARPGFDYWASHKGQGEYYDTVFNINGKRGVLKGYYTQRVTDLATAWLKEPHTKPFLLVLGHKAPHMLSVPEEKYAHAFDRYKFDRPATANDTQKGKPEWVRQRLATWHGIDGPLYGSKDYPDFIQRYLGTILSIDDSVGRVYDTLKDIGCLDDTIFVHAADHGFMLGEHGCVDKRVMYEESIRIPFLVRYPALIRANTVITEQVLNIDFAPSILDLCGVPSLPKVHGKSWVPLLRGENKGWRESWYYEYNYEKEFPYTPNVRGVRTSKIKYIHYPNGGTSPDRATAELYDMVKDRQETNNLIDTDAASEAEMQAELVRLQQQVNGLPDSMPINPQMKMELPDKSIR